MTPKMPDTVVRRMWNYRCAVCFNESVVFVDNDQCFYCDPQSVAYQEAQEAKLWAEEANGKPAP